VKKELKKIKYVFSVFDDRAVRYCHWKSNQHLDAALAGETDLDILVDGNQAGLCRQILHSCGCKQVMPQPRAQYPGIEDWLVFDSVTGSLAHIHLHFRLIAGSHPKNYHLPVESWLLSDCASFHDLKIPTHEKELIVLLVRIAFKIHCLDLLKAFLVPGYEFLSLAIKAELDWLLARVPVESISGHLSSSGLPVDSSLLVDFIDRYASGLLTPAYCFAFKVKLGRSLKRFKIRSFAGVQALRLKFFIKSLVPHVQTRKTLFGRGVFFALVGADGSGKTRLVGDLLSWLGWKLETETLYFGIPKAARAYRCFLKTIDVVERLGKKAQALGCNFLSNLFFKLSGGIESLLWIYIAYRRLALGRRAKVARENRFIMIGERFPLRCFMEMSSPMDGPRLQKQSERSMLSGFESFFYNRIEPPDHLFVLKARVEVLHARKSITPMNSLREKADAVNRIKADEKTTVIDAEASYESVLRMIKTDVWNML